MNSWRRWLFVVGVLLLSVLPITFFVFSPVTFLVTTFPVYIFMPIARCFKNVRFGFWGMLGAWTIAAFSVGLYIYVHYGLVTMREWGNLMVIMSILTCGGVGAIWASYLRRGYWLAFLLTLLFAPWVMVPIAFILNRLGLFAVR